MLSFSKKINYFVLSLAFFVLISFGYFITKIAFKQTEINADYINPAESLFGLSIPKDIHFAGEAVPQDDYSIKENLDKEFIGSSSSAYVLLKRCALWFPPIEAVLKRNNIPDDIKYIALEESNLTNSQSSQGAAGFWQFVASTGANYGLEINDDVDERYSVEKSTEAACKFFKEAYKRFGSWTIAAAAYNLGSGGIEQQLKKQKSTNYYDLMLNKETARYLYRVLALKTLVESSSKHKSKISKSFYGVPLTPYKVDTAVIDLSRFAVSLGYTYNLLKIFNPWLRKNTLPNPTKKTYVINFPKKEYLKNGFTYFEGDLVRESLDTTVGQKNVKLDSILPSNDSEKEIKNLKKDTEKNEQPH
ncbi:MAG TPA: lytic transglycosylase domain-containing protein [Bacteroidia bacterium]|nr:lytic transglycosylase domain-containing protein [Bacteroidia bacterium]